MPHVTRDLALGSWPAAARILALGPFMLRSARDVDNGLALKSVGLDGALGKRRATLGSRSDRQL